jgi:hypothetical protein
MPPNTDPQDEPIILAAPTEATAETRASHLSLGQWVERSI